MRILCLGEALVDLVCPRPAASLAGAGAFAPGVGGTAATVAALAARRGADVALAGVVGADPWGAWLAERLDAEGVDVSALGRREDVTTPVAFTTADASGRPASVLHGAGLEPALAALDAEAVLAAVAAAGALFTTSNVLAGDAEREVTLAAHERALRDGRPVVFAPAFRLDRWRSASAAVAASGPLVDGAFLVQADREEARALTGEADPVAAAESLLAAGARHAVVTLGAEGAVLRGGGLDRAVPGVPATVVDTTGAGAAVSAVLLAALARTGFYPASIAAMLPDAMAEAARATERYGALAG